MILIQAWRPSIGPIQIQVVAQKIQVEPKRHSSQQMWNFKSKLYVKQRIIPSWNR